MSLWLLRNTKIQAVALWLKVVIDLLQLPSVFRVLSPIIWIAVELKRESFHRRTLNGIDPILMARRRPRYVSTSLLYESQLILNKVISSKTNEGYEIKKIDKFYPWFFGRLYTTRRLVKQFQKITNMVLICASISLIQTLDVANVPKCVYFVAAVSVVSIYCLLLSFMFLLLLLLRFIELTQKLHRLRQITTLLNSPSRRSKTKVCKRKWIYADEIHFDLAIKLLAFDLRTSM